MTTRCEFDKYPSVYSLQLTTEECILNNNSYIISISISPTANCQTFTIGGSQIIDYINKKFIPEFLRTLVSITGKYQFIIDIYEETSNSILKKLLPYTKDVKSISYTNGTGREMILHLIFLDAEKF